MSAPVVSPIIAYSTVQHLGFDMSHLKRIKVSENFTWAEVFHNRTIADVKMAGIDIYHNALRTAGRLEAIRRFLRQQIGQPIVIQITSWYRSPIANAAVGGAKNSQHTLGLAADFIVPGFSDKRGNQYIQALLIGVKDSIKFCLEITNGTWTHVDCRPACFVFENKGGGQYPLMSVVQMTDFVRKYGKAA